MTDRLALTEVLIIGAGPAGLGTALHLLRIDPAWAGRLLIVEKESHPRHKLCGGGISPFGLSQLAALDLELGVEHVPVETAHLEFHDLRMKIQGDPVIAVTHREDFDAWLAEQAQARGIRLLENSPVEAIDTLPDGFWVRTPSGTIEARLLVGADGTRGIVRRWIGARERPPHIARLLETVSPRPDETTEHRRKIARLDFSVLGGGIQGYYWDFPSRIDGLPHLNSGVYDSRVFPSESKGDLRGSLTGTLLHHQNRSLGQFEGHPIRWFAPTNLLSRPGVLLVGDAAGVDPLFGEGIGVALAQGEIAAEMIQRAFSRGDFRLRGYRWRLLRSRVGRYLLFRWLGANLLYRNAHRPFILRLIWRLAILASHFVRRWNVQVR